jgi:hypothetical protein
VTTFTIRREDLGFPTGVDCTDQLNEHIARAVAASEAGDTIELIGYFPCDHTPTVRHFDGIVELTAAQIKVRTVYNWRNRHGAPCLTLLDCPNIVVNGGELVGTNVGWLAGIRRWPSLILGLIARRTHIGWHGVKIARCGRVTLRGVGIWYVESDFVYIAGKNGDVTLENCTGDTAGRHGVVWRSCGKLKIDNCAWRRIKRIRYDHEPLPYEGFDQLDITNDRGESGRLAECNYMQLRGGPRTRMGPIAVALTLLDRGHHLIRIVSGPLRRPGVWLNSLESLDPNDVSLPVGDRMIEILGTGGFDHVVIGPVREHVSQAGIDHDRVVHVAPYSTNVAIDTTDVRPAVTP